MAEFELLRKQDVIDTLKEQVDIMATLSDEQYGYELQRRGVVMALNLVESLPALKFNKRPILCKECKHWTRNCGDEQWSLGDCDIFEKRLVMCNGYCAWAERKTDE